MFDPILEQFTTIAQDFWLFLVGLIVIAALLGGLWYVLQGTTGAVFGGSKTTSIAIVGVVGIVLMVLFAFLILPELGDLLNGFKPEPPF
jgi:hypothetical protein